MYTQSSFSGEQDEKTGRLYLVATPIGNLSDITVRALETLKEVDMIAAEDTRQTRKLLTHFQIEGRLISHHEFNKQASLKGIIQALQEGKNVALVSDAGMPAISDPGYELVREATRLELPVIPIPGANAGLSALIASGLPTSQFIFLGFLSRDKKQLHGELSRVRRYPETIICYESPHRIKKMLKETREVLGNRQVVLARELTKKYEQFIRGSLDEVIDYLTTQEQIRGEFTVVIEGCQEEEREENNNEQAWWKELSIEEHVDTYISQGHTSKEAIKKTAEDLNVSKRDIYNQYHT